MRIPRDPVGIDKAKRLRRDMTPPERAMWRVLRAHRLQDWKFSRQVSVEPYVIDFAARRERLGIELDGDSHATTEQYDSNRTAFLERQGWRIVRFTNRDILSNPEGVGQSIMASLRCGGGPSPRPSPRRGEGV